MISRPTATFFRWPTHEAVARGKYLRPALLTYFIFSWICQISAWGHSTTQNANADGSAVCDIPMREHSCTSFIQGGYTNTRGHAPGAFGDDVEIPEPPTLMRTDTGMLPDVPAFNSRAANKRQELEHVDGHLQERAVGVFADGRDSVRPFATLHPETTVAKVDGPLPNAQSVKLPLESPVEIKMLPSIKWLIATVRNVTIQNSLLQRYVQLQHIGSSSKSSSSVVLIVAVSLGTIALFAAAVGLIITIGGAATKPKEDRNGAFGQHFPRPEPAIPVDLSRASRPTGNEGGIPAIQKGRSMPLVILPDTARTLPCGSGKSLPPMSARRLTDRVAHDHDSDPVPRSNLDVNQVQGTPLMSSEGTSGDHLAPWMVVPSTAMVELLVPRVKLNGDHDFATTFLHVDDINGVPMFLANFVASDALGPGGRDLKLIVTNPVNRAVHASCRLTQARNSLVIYRSSGTPFGKLSPAHQHDGSYIVRTLRFGEVVFTKESSSDMCIVDNEHRDLGIVGAWNQEDPAVLRKAMLVGPSADAVLIVLCLLGIDWLDFELGRHRGARWDRARR